MSNGQWIERATLDMWGGSIPCADAKKKARSRDEAGRKASMVGK